MSDIAKNDNDFDRWRAHLLYHLPSFARRVFDLRNCCYPGYGFHYDLESELGYVISILNAHNDRYPSDMRSRLVIKVRIKAFMKDLQRAECSIH